MRRSRRKVNILLVAGARATVDITLPAGYLPFSPDELLVRFIIILVPLFLILAIILMDKGGGLTLTECGFRSKTGHEDAAWGGVVVNANTGDAIYRVLRFPQGGREVKRKIIKFKIRGELKQF